VIDCGAEAVLESGMVISLEMEFRHEEVGHVKIEDMAAMGMVRLRVFAWLRQQRRDLASRDIELPAAATVQGMLDAVQLALPEGVIILVNDLRASTSSPVRAGDVVSVFPMLEGG